MNGLPDNITTTREAVAGVISVARNIAQPFGTNDPNRPFIAPTLWRTVYDLTNKVYYYESTTSPNIIWVRFDDFSQGVHVKNIDLVKEPDRIGNVSSEFKDAEPFEFAKPLIT